MANNPYTREAKLSIVEIVPEHDELPDCAAVLMTNSALCPNKARYLQNDVPVCGVHVARNSTILWRSSRR